MTKVNTNISIGGKVETGLRSQTGPGAPWHSKPGSPAPETEYKAGGGRIKLARGGAVDGHAQAKGHEELRVLQPTSGGVRGKMKVTGDTGRSGKSRKMGDEASMNRGGAMKTMGDKHMKKAGGGGVGSGEDAPFAEEPIPGNGLLVDGDMAELNETEHAPRGGDTHHHYYFGAAEGRAFGGPVGGPPMAGPPQMGAPGLGAPAMPPGIKRRVAAAALQRRPRQVSPMAPPAGAPPAPSGPPSGPPAGPPPGMAKRGGREE